MDLSDPSQVQILKNATDYENFIAVDTTVPEESKQNICKGREENQYDKLTNTLVTNQLLIQQILEDHQSSMSSNQEEPEQTDLSFSVFLPTSNKNSKYSS